jgi:hypothetical protein
MKRKPSFSRRESDSFAFKRFRELNYNSTVPDVDLDSTVVKPAPTLLRFDDAFEQKHYIDADVLIDIFYSLTRFVYIHALQVLF